MSMTLSGPMFEPAKTNYFESSFKKEGAHYNIFSTRREDDGMAALRQIFPEGEADGMNFVVFSTSGVHGLYNTIENAEKHLANPSDETCDCVTFLMIHPRIVCMRYGNCLPKNAEDIAYLKKLRASSWNAVLQIGKP